MSSLLPATQLLKDDAALANVDKAKYFTLASDASIAKAKAALEGFKFKVDVVNSGKDALEILKTLAPKGASVSNTGSTTLQEVGFVDYLKANTHGWHNTHEALMNNKDDSKASELRAASLTADYVFTSICALGEDGSIVAVDLTGNRVGGIGAAKNVVIVVGAQKIVPTVEDGNKRASEWCLPLESARVRIVYKIPASAINNSISIRGNNPFSPVQRFHVIIVKESLGY